jgi:hypothetical protein
MAGLVLSKRMPDLILAESLGQEKGQSKNAILKSASRASLIYLPLAFLDGQRG